MPADLAPSLAAFRFEASKIGQLLSRQALPTLGEIAWSVKWDLKWAPWQMPKPDYLKWRCQDYHPFYWKGLDKVLGGRLDYRLWRLVAKRLHLSEEASGWPPLSDTALQAIETTEPIVVWGALAVLNGFLTSKRLRELLPNPESRLRIADRMVHRMSVELAPILGGEVDCTIIKMLAWCGNQQVQYALRGALSVSDANKFYDRLESCLRESDPNWEPGAPPRFGEALKREQVVGRVVSPFDRVELTLRVTEALFKARAVAREAVRVLDKPSDELLKRATLLAFSSWRFTRSFRIGEQVFQSKNPTYIAEFSLASLQRAEMVALRRFGQSLRDAGCLLDAAFAAWLLLTLMPDQLLDDKKFRGLGTDLAGVLRQAGLDVPTRFVRQKDSNAERTENRTDDVATKVTEISEVTSAEIEKAGEEWRRRDPFRLRLAQDLEYDERWKLIRRAEPDTQNDPFAALGRVVDSSKETAGDVDTLKAAFGLCMKYGRLRECVRLADKLSLSADELLDLAHSMKRSLQLNLLAVNHDQQAKWRESLRLSWTRLPERDQLSPAQRLVMHELLLGRYPSILRDAGLASSRVLASRFYNQLSDDEIRDFVDIGPRAFQRGLGVLTIPNLVQALASMTGGSLRAPACVSVALLTEDRASLIGVGPHGTNVEDLQLPYIREAAAAVASTYFRWLPQTRSAGRELRIPSHSTLMKLGDGILDLAYRINPSCRWLALALEPELASLPWAHLLKARERDLVVSLIPSFSWFVKARAPAGEWDGLTPAPTFRISPDSNLAEAARQIEADAELVRDLIGSCGIVLGHGKPTNKGFPTVTLGASAINLSEWLELALHRILIVNSCHGGRVSRSFPSDLGGLPGIALSIGCRLFLAPVTEVPVDAAVTLHEELVRRDGPVEIGLRYLAAIERDPVLSLYNLFGLADEEIKRASSTSPNL